MKITYEFQIIEYCIHKFQISVDYLHTILVFFQLQWNHIIESQFEFVGECKQVLESNSNPNSQNPVYLGLLYIQRCY